MIETASRRQRLAMAAAAAAAALAALSAMDNSEFVLDIGIGDSVLLLLLFVVNALLCARLLLARRGRLVIEALLLLGLNGMGLWLRLASGLFLGPEGVPLEESVPPQHGWMPLIFVMAFAFLPLRLALLVSGLAWGLLAGTLLVYFGLHSELMLDSLTGRMLLRQYLLAHPIYIGLLWIIAMRAKA